MVGPSLEILHEDEALLVVGKPAGIHTAPLREGEKDTLLALVLSAFPEISSLPGLKPSEPGLMHRLDRDTSGVVVIARTTAAFSALRSQFASGLVRKEYHAACACRTEADQQRRLSVTSRFAPAGPGRRMVRVVSPEEKNTGLLREATRSVYLTEARIVERKGERALAEVVIQRGFRHQVRAHLSYAGWPIFGDSLYGVPAPSDVPKRMYLHASGISFAHPVTGEQLHVVSPLPDAFRVLLSSGNA